MMRLEKLMTLAVLAAPALAPGAEEETGHGAHAAAPEAIQGVSEGLATGITALVVFFVVFGILSVKVWPTISRALAERAEKIRSEVAAAERARQQAKDALEQYQKSLAEARAEAQRMLEQTKASQQALAAELKAKADAELTQMKERARRDIEAAKRAALTEIYDAAAEFAGSMASKILRREVQAGDTRRLIEESLDELQTAKA